MTKANFREWLKGNLGIIWISGFLLLSLNSSAARSLTNKGDCRRIRHVIPVLAVDSMPENGVKFSALEMYF